MLCVTRTQACDRRLLLPACVPECHKHVLGLPGLCGVPAAKVGRGGAEPGKGGCQDAVLQERCSTGLSLLRMCSANFRISSYIWTFCRLEIPASP